jgi:hypothetical protein
MQLGEEEVRERVGGCAGVVIIAPELVDFLQRSSDLARMHKHYLARAGVMLLKCWGDVLNIRDDALIRAHAAVEDTVDTTIMHQA